MNGTRVGDHLHDVIREWTGENFTPACGCERWMRKMNRGGVPWTRSHLWMIVKKLRIEAGQRKWWRQLAKLPGVQFPIRAMVLEAIGRAERDA